MTKLSFSQILGMLYSSTHLGDFDFNLMHWLLTSSTCLQSSWHCERVSSLGRSVGKLPSSRLLKMKTIDLILEAIKEITGYSLRNYSDFHSVNSQPRPIPFPLDSKISASVNSLWIAHTYSSGWFEIKFHAEYKLEVKLKWKSLFWWDNDEKQVIMHSAYVRLIQNSKLALEK